MNQNNNHQNNRNQQNNQNGRNKQNSQFKQNNEKDQKDKKVLMRYQVSNSKEVNSVKLKKTVDGIVEKTKLSIYKDGSDEAYL